MSKNRPFTVDHVGSFLRPQSIKEARKKVQEGLLSKEELRAIEDQEIKKLVEDQKVLVVPPFFRKNILSLSLTIKSVVLVTKDCSFLPTFRQKIL